MNIPDPVPPAKEQQGECQQRNLPQAVGKTALRDLHEGLHSAPIQWQLESWALKKMPIAQTVDLSRTFIQVFERLKHTPVLEGNPALNNSSFAGDNTKSPEFFALT